MLIFLALLYFCLASCAIWLALFPNGRAFVARGLGALRQRLSQRALGWQIAGSRYSGAVRGSVPRDVQGSIVRFVRRHRIACAIGVPAVLIPSLLALALSSPAMLPVYEGGTAMPDVQVAALLQGERLAPPSALPPSVFTTGEVELVRPLLVSASRNWGLLHPDFNQRLLLAFKIMKEKHGYDMALLEGYRSPARQDELASAGSHVTNARAFQSWHQYGLAADCAFLRDGKLVISEKDPWAMRGYQLYGEVAESLGLTWGGRWKMMDFGHTELRMRGVMQR
ncbi:M15 family metallopeptidase [Massilia yuzhufengensis]|uniref:Peptidoglycan L-alanyl-D-glutamate endopeptidase CwlK n=1 Tax=Massilia yuzhufengensis TaxID=1164594 RepID=A0A1I1EC53_9BURK|nr:M15 family metallopeptidase [Massilia yuzhufengensis]SFB84704.1 peptidoglycan L-alanyl-D-glutamate endopeptidase CwlK [Massilia yuzhufengensis]